MNKNHRVSSSNSNTSKKLVNMRNRKTLKIISDNKNIKDKGKKI